MKWYGSFSVFAALAVLVTAGSAGAVQAGERAEMLKRFEQLKANSLRALASSQVQQVQTSIKGDPQNRKFNLVVCDVPPADPLVPGQAPVRLGVKIWAELVPSGQLVNLTKHRWDPKERFWLWIESAVPLQMSLFQNYPEGRPASRQVSPDERFPASFATIVPGQPFRFPIMLQMDGDMRNEQVSLVFMKSDAVFGPTAPPVSAASASASVVVDTRNLPPGSRVIVDAFAAASTVGGRPSANASAVASVLGGIREPDGTLKGTSIQRQKSVMASIKDTTARAPAGTPRPELKFNLVAPPSNNPRDVELLILGPGNLAQIELTLFK